MYAVKNDEGKWLGCEIYCDEPDWFDHGGFIWDTRSIAEENVKLYGGHVVKLVDAQTKVVVSEEEAKMLEEAKDDYCAASVIRDYSVANIGAMGQDRLMRAYVIGWTVEKPKQYLVKVKGHFERPTYYALRFNEYLAFGYREQDQQKLSDYPAYPFTEDEIIKYGLENCEKVEISNKGEKDE